jgi:hypothetical protein
VHGPPPSILLVFRAATWARKGTCAPAAKLQNSHPSDVLDIKHRRLSVVRADSDRFLDSMAHMDFVSVEISLHARFSWDMNANKHAGKKVSSILVRF